MALMAADWGESQVPFDKTDEQVARIRHSLLPGPSKLCLVWQGNDIPWRRQSVVASGCKVNKTDALESTPSERFPRKSDASTPDNWRPPCV